MKKETIFRIQEEDFRTILKDKHVPTEEWDEIINNAHDHFEIYDWSEYVSAFIDNLLDLK